MLSGRLDQFKVRNRVQELARLGNNLLAMGQVTAFVIGDHLDRRVVERRLDPGDWDESVRGDVALESSPAVEARDIKIETSVRNKKIDASMTVTNHTEAEVRLRV